jgi:hypothetical protein
MNNGHALSFIPNPEPRNPNPAYAGLEIAGRIYYDRGYMGWRRRYR